MYEPGLVLKQCTTIYTLLTEAPTFFFLRMNAARPVMAAAPTKAAAVPAPTPTVKASAVCF